jgi:hypothetical protein
MRRYTALYSGAELYQIFVRIALFEPEQSANRRSVEPLVRAIKPDFRIKPSFPLFLYNSVTIQS